MFDPLTLLAVLALTHLLSTSSLAVVWYVNQTIPGIKEWTIGRLLVTLAIVAFALRASVSLPLSVVIGNALMAVGFYVMLMGHRRFMGRKPFKIAPFAALLLIYSGSRYFCESMFWASKPKQTAKT